MWVNLVVGGKWCNQLFMIDGQIYACSQDMTEKDLLYIVGLAQKDGLYIANTVILKILWIVCPITAFWLTYPLFWPWSKKRGLRPLCTYVVRIAVEFKVCIRFQCICINICTDLLLPVGLMYYTKRKSLYIVEKTGLVNLMSIVGFLDSTYIAVARLNHPIEPFWFSATAVSFFSQYLVAILWAKLVFIYVPYRESVNNNQIQVVTFLFLVGCF